MKISRLKQSLEGTKSRRLNRYIIAAKLLGMTGAAPTSLENLADFATVVLAVIGVVGACFALFQIEHARKARLATVYLAVSKEWDALSGARVIVTNGPFNHRDVTSNGERGRMLLEILERNLPFESDGQIDAIINEIQCQALEASLENVLSYVEDLGLLCRQSYVAQTDVFDIIGSSINEIMEIMLPYIERNRMDFDQDPTIHANALWLYERVKKSPQFSIEGYGTPRLFFRKNAPEIS